MAVIVSETTGRESSGDKSSLQTGVVQTLTDRKVRAFRVSGVATDTAALVASGIPQIDDTHPQDTRLLARRASATGVTPTIFDVRIEYEFVGPASSSGNGLPPPSISCSSALLEEATQFDTQDKQILNAAGEAPDGTITRNCPILTFHYEFSSLTFGAGIVFSHVGCVNDGDWTSQTFGQIPMNCALLRGVSATQQTLTDTFYYRVTYDIAFKSLIVKGTQVGWQLALLNAGFMFKNPSLGGKLDNIRSTDGTIPRGGPWLLSADGTDNSLKNPNVIPNFFLKTIYYGAPFGALNIP